MRLKKTIRVSFRIVLLFITAILLSTVPDYLFSFFGDTVCNGIIFNKIEGKNEFFTHWGGVHKDVQVHWGYRHYLYFLMGFCLTIVQIVDIISIIEENEKTK